MRARGPVSCASAIGWMMWCAMSAGAVYAADNEQVVITGFVPAPQGMFNRLVVEKLWDWDTGGLNYDNNVDWYVDPSGTTRLRNLRVIDSMIIEGNLEVYGTVTARQGFYGPFFEDTDAMPTFWPTWHPGEFGRVDPSGLSLLRQAEIFSLKVGDKDNPPSIYGAFTSYDVSNLEGGICNLRRQTQDPSKLYPISTQQSLMIHSGSGFESWLNVFSWSDPDRASSSEGGYIRNEYEPWSESSNPPPAGHENLAVLVRDKDGFQIQTRFDRLDRDFTRFLVQEEGLRIYRPRNYNPLSPLPTMDPEDIARFGDGVLGTPGVNDRVVMENAYVEQRVGINEPDPTVRLHVTEGRIGPGNGVVAIDGDASTGNEFTGHLGLRNNGPSGSAIRLVYVDGTVPGDPATAAIESRFLSGGMGYLSLQTRPLASSLTEVMRLSPEGRVGIGTSSPSGGHKLHVNGRVLAAGYDTVSDARLKTQVAPLRGALEKLGRIRPVMFAWDRAAADAALQLDVADGREVGVLAQDVEAVLPELVTVSDNGYRSVDYSRLTAVLLGAVQELRAENMALQRRIEQLERYKDRR